ncbi:SDR family oxidoreductase [Pelagibacterium xiamenense]|uniref:SDR family oxidoreductase n=1 Tax=Pelagibacterium xiamenense TaxID=2901140 RepID=UPI001E54BA03|nr:SDR family oxidoreductase [Pelagibacterium xiamenense]MCD7060313.1 SDR family oxidoreductase [Pelagibacterium xiamenense]
MLAVTGATGQLGRLVIQSLKDKGVADQVVALVRNTAKAADLGVSVREANYDKPATLAPALEGVEKLLLISSSEVGKRVSQHEAVIAAAKAAGVRQIIYTSILRADTTEIPLADEHRPTEAAIKASGIPYVFLRNGWYTENYTGALGGAIASGALIGSSADGKLSLATRADYAEAAAAVLASDGHEGKIYELAGNEPVTAADLASEVSRQTGKTLPYTYLPPADYAAVLTQVGLPEGYAKMIAASDDAASRGALHDESGTLGKLIGRPTTPLSKAVEDALAA